MIPFLVALVRFLRLLRELLRMPQTRALMAMVGMTLFIGAWFYHLVEGWSDLDSLYFCVITLTTIGYGDLAPKSDIGKVFTMMYVVIGVGLLVGLVDLVAENRMESLTSRSSKRTVLCATSCVPKGWNRRSALSRAISAWPNC